MKKAVKFVIFIFFIACFIYLGTRDYEIDTKKKINNKKTSEVLFSDDTVFTKVNHSKLLSRLSSSSANLIIYACIDSNKICASYGNLINEVAKNYSISEIYYYDFLDDRNNNNATYQKIISYFKDYLYTDDLGKQHFQAPTLIIIKDGNIFAFDDELSRYRGDTKQSEYLTDEKLEEKRLYLINVLEGYLENE